MGEQRDELSTERGLAVEAPDAAASAGQPSVIASPLIAATEPAVPGGSAAPTEAEIELGAAERLTFFSDAVVAIAITLLALELPVPNGASSEALFTDLGDHSGEYISFLISFVVIAGHWAGHHRVFRYLARAQGLTGPNLVWLLMIVLTPFATRVLSGGDSDDGSFDLRFVFYAVVQVIADAIFLLMVYRMEHRRLAFPGTRPSLYTVSYWRVGCLALAFAISIPLVFVIGQFAFFAWFLIPVLGAVVGRRVGIRRDTAAKPTPGQPATD